LKKTRPTVLPDNAPETALRIEMCMLFMAVPVIVPDSPKMLSLGNQLYESR